MALGRAVVGPEVQFSGKFTGLCRYLSRLLRFVYLAYGSYGFSGALYVCRPIWNYRMTTTFKPPGDYLNEQVKKEESKFKKTSTMVSEEKK